MKKLANSYLVISCIEEAGKLTLYYYVTWNEWTTSIDAASRFKTARDASGAIEQLKRYGIDSQVLRVIPRKVANIQKI